MSASKPSVPLYVSEDSRLASFSSKTRVKWPHPSSFSVTPASLAASGFYFNPSEDAEDSARCFLCEKQLGGWEEGDTALEQHLSHTKNACSFARMRAIQAAREADEDWLEDPSNAWMRDMHSQEAIAVRKQTFEISGYKWPHDRKKGWGPTSSNLAAAGFSLNLQKIDDGDTAVCVYCGLCLSGWEKSDDPLEEHRRRIKDGASCAFFAQDASEARVEKAVSSAPKASSSTKKKQRASRKTPGQSSQAAVSETELESQPSRKRKTRGGRSAAPSDEDEPASQPPLRQSRRGTSKVAPSASAASLADDDKPAKPARKPRAGKKTKKSKATEEDEEEAAEPSPPAQPQFVEDIVVESKGKGSSSSKKRASQAAVVIEQPRRKKAKSAITPEPENPLSAPVEPPVPMEEEPLPMKDEKVIEAPPTQPLIDLDGDDEPIAPPQADTEPSVAAPDSDEAMLVEPDVLLPPDLDAHGLSAVERGLTVKEWYQRQASQAHDRLAAQLQSKLQAFDEKAASARRDIVGLVRGGE